MNKQMPTIFLRLIVIALAVIGMVRPIHAQQVEFNYNGRLNVQNGPFTGTGAFKLALTNADGSVTFWANDGLTLDGNEPTTAVTIAMNDGFFSIDVGDTNLPGMALLNASIFNNGDVYLRTWFNDGTSGFQRLLPDKKIVNPALLGLFNSSKDTIIYVDPVNGNDSNTGLSTDSAKLTLQNAWNTIPPLIQNNMTVQLLDGLYHESLNLMGKTAIGDARITITGNPADRTSVRFTGYNHDQTSVTLSRAFTIKNQDRLFFSNISIDHYADEALYLQSSEVEINNCLIRDNHRGIVGFSMSNLMVLNTEVYNIVRHPFYIQEGTNARLTNCYMHHYGDRLSCLFNSTLIVESGRYGNTSSAFEAAFGGCLNFNLNVLPLTRIENCSVGINVSGNGTVSFANTGVTYINTPSHVVSGAGTPSIIN